MILHTTYSVNRWLAQKLGRYGHTAFTEAEDLPLPGFQVAWGEERELQLSPRGALSGTRFSIFCAAPSGQRHISRRLATIALAVLREASAGFAIPRYRYPFREGDQPVGRITLRDISARELHDPKYPELALHIVRATALTINPPTC